MPAPDPSPFPHFMLKEIFEQPQALANLLRGCMRGSTVALPAPMFSSEEIRSLRKITIAASGTSRHAGLAGEFMLERMTGIPVEVDFASQYCYRDPIVGQDELTIFISQSGTTADTLAALHEARRKGSKTLTICNVPDTPLVNEADAALLTGAGKEVAIAATKSFTTQLLALFLLSAYIARERGHSSGALDAACARLAELPALVERSLGLSQRTEQVARLLADSESVLFLGRDIDYAIALEGALKLKEVSYIHAEGYPTGEVKHGPFALISNQLPLVFVSTYDRANPASEFRWEKSLSSIREIAERDSKVIVVMTEGDSDTARLTPYTLAVPDVPVLLQPIVEVIPLQLLAYHVAVQRGLDVDHPRNLSKSVVTE